MNKLNLFMNERIMEIAQLVANVATAIAVIIALVGAGIAWHQLRTTRTIQREATASSIYQAFLALSIQHPRLAAPDPTVVEAGRGDPEFEQYEWYVASLLFTCERILELTAGHPAWKRSIHEHMVNHRRFLTSPEFSSDLYSAPLCGIIANAVRETPEQPDASRSSSFCKLPAALEPGQIHRPAID